MYVAARVMLMRAFGEGGQWERGCTLSETPTAEQSANESTRDPPNTFDCGAMEERGAVQSLAGLSIS